TTAIATAIAARAASAAAITTTVAARATASATTAVASVTAAATTRTVIAALASLADADRALGVSLAHGEVDATEVVDLDDLHLDDVAHLHDVLHAVDAVLGQLGDVHHAVLVREDLDEGPEGHDPADGAL